MTWQNPWAWAGLALLAVPLLIHLLGRRTAREQPFPTLRFLDASRLLPVRRTRLQDLALLALRLAIVLLAVAALAQPFLLTVERERSLTSRLHRVLVIDTSASMQRTSPGGERLLDVARREAQRLAGEANTSIVLETAAPGRALAGAAHWLESLAGTREIAILSDFQVGALDSTDLAVLPDGTGLRLHAFIARADDGPITITTRQYGMEFDARVWHTGDTTQVTWAAQSATSTLTAPRLLAAAEARPVAEAVLRAVLVSNAPAADPVEPIAIVYAGFENLAAIEATAAPLDEPWMGDMFLRVRADALLHAAAAQLRDDSVRLSSVAITDGPVGTAVVRSPGGAPIVQAARAVIEGRDHLVFFVAAEPGSLLSAALIAAIDAARGPVLATGEYEPATLDAATLERWQRAATGVLAARDASDASDGRWLWLAVLLLLGVETWVRRRGTKHRGAVA